MIGRGDVVIAISNSGESAELLEILPLVKRLGAKLVAITGKPDSTLAREADVNLDAAVAEEACPHNLAPTASTTAALALGDALAVALLDARGFSAADFALHHPRGQLPRQALANQALLHVKDVMRGGADVPKVPEQATLQEALLEMTRGRIGMTAVLDKAGRICGIFTDGDLRRALQKITDVSSTRVGDVMSRDPRSIRPEALAAEAVQIMESHKVNQILVVDARGELVGALNMHDLFRAKVI
jgi:arabinose-5-phosphate isomerase